jgi:hypothetical protein
MPAARRTIWDRLVRPDGSPVAGVRVRIDVLPAGTQDPDDDLSIVRPAVVTTDEMGRWEAEVRPTDQLVPRTARYRIRIPGMWSPVYVVHVPTDDLSPVWVGDLAGRGPE